MQQPYDIGIGVLIFNPEDDTEHLERIEKCISSIVAASNNTDAKTLIMLLMNMSVIGKPQVDGVGPLTKSLVKSYAEKANDKVILKERESPHSMIVNHYAHLQNELHDAVCNKVVVFADDYIVPAKWIDTVINEFEEFPTADFITPSTNFVAQKHLLVPIEIKPQWNTVTHDNNVKGVSSGISQKDVEDLAQKCSGHRTIKYMPQGSFETTVFTKEFLNKYGYVDNRYFSILYNTEYFINAVLGGAKGYISRKSYVFHYGKGGTAAVEKETRDEKHAGSPVEKYLLEDIKLFNKNTGSSRKKWWSDKPAISEFLDNDKIEMIIKIDDYRDGCNKKFGKWKLSFYKRYLLLTRFLSFKSFNK
ncbi:MAG: hypothetical protein K0U41_02460 [Gammaproteobacteria bacterium]|nr:hypothetical protein [Gammaproteobacteria bacterium]